MADETLLTITSVGVPPYSARGLKQTLEPIDQAANYFRTINGGMVNVGRTQFQQYKSTITGDDQNPPAFDSFWPGQIVEVDCIAELSYPQGGSPGRTVVPASSYSEANFVIYRPRLTMMVTKFTTEKDEYGATTSWALDLEESA